MQIKRMTRAGEAERTGQEVNPAQEACRKHANVTWCEKPNQKRQKVSSLSKGKSQMCGQ